MKGITSLWSEQQDITLHVNVCFQSKTSACRPCRLYKLQLGYYKLIYIKEEKHPYTYTRLQITGIYFEKHLYFLFHRGIHSHITSMIHCTDSYKLMSITFWKHCRFSSISLKTRTVRAWSAEDGFSDYQATS